MFERLSYRPFVPRVGRLGGAARVTRSGMVVDPVWLPRTMYWHEWVALRALAIAAASAVRRGFERIASDRPLAVIHSLWTAGHYHWLTEALPRALAVRRAFPEAVPALPRDHYERYEPSLRALGFECVRWFAEGRNAILDRPVVSECPPMFGTTDPELLRDVRSAIVGHYFPAGPPVARKIVYVSREKARGRRVINEAEVIAALRPVGAEIVNLEDHDFEQQVRLLAETKLLISIHGAGLANMMWMRPGGAVIELLPRRNGLFDWHTVRRSFRHDACYVRLADAMGHAHRAFVGQARHGRFEGTWNADLSVDAAALAALAAELAA